MDVIIRVDHLPHTEENLHPDGQQFAIGGCAYNAANILGRGGAPVTFVTPVGLQGVFGTFVRDRLQTLPFAQPSYLPDAANGCCYCLVEARGERTFLSIHGAEYSFDPAWMARYAAERYAYGYVCGLEIEERPAVCWWIISKPPRLIEFVCASRGRANRATERTAALFRPAPMLHLNAWRRALSGHSDLMRRCAPCNQRTQALVIATLGRLRRAGFGRGRRAAHRAGSAGRARGGYHRRGDARTRAPFCWGSRAASRFRMRSRWAIASARRWFKPRGATPRTRRAFPRAVLRQTGCLTVSSHFFFRAHKSPRAGHHRGARS